MPPLTKAQKTLVDKVRQGNPVIILSKYERNPYLWTYFTNAKPTVSRISDGVINSLIDNGVFQSTRQRVEENEQVEMMLFEYELQNYIEKRIDEV